MTGSSEIQQKERRSTLAPPLIEEEEGWSGCHKGQRLALNLTQNLLLCSPDLRLDNIIYEVTIRAKVKTFQNLTLTGDWTAPFKTNYQCSAQGN